MTSKQLSTLLRKLYNAQYKGKPLSNKDLHNLWTIVAEKQMEAECKESVIKMPNEDEVLAALKEIRI